MSSASETRGRILSGQTFVPLPVQGKLHWNVQLGWPTLIYGHSTLFWMLITTVRIYESFYIHGFYMDDETKVISFRDLILTQGNLHGWSQTSQRQPDCKY